MNRVVVTGISPDPTMAAALIAKFSEADAGDVAGIANDVAAAVSSEGIGALETNSVLADLEVWTMHSSDDSFSDMTALIVLVSVA